MSVYKLKEITKKYYKNFWALKPYYFKKDVINIIVN